MQEFRDGSFGPIRPAAELLQHLQTEDLEQTKRIHFGTMQELERIRKRTRPGGNSSKKSRRDARRRLPALERKVAELEQRLERAAAERDGGIRVYPESALAELDARRARV